MHAGENHNTIPLATARISLEAHFAGRIKKCSDKVTELCKLEKQTWQTVDELNEKCVAMMNQVDSTAEKQVYCIDCLTRMIAVAVKHVITSMQLMCVINNCNKITILQMVRTEWWPQDKIERDFPSFCITSVFLARLRHLIDDLQLY